MKKTSNKSTRRQPIDPVSLSSKQCKDSLKSICEPGSPFADGIHARAIVMTPLLKEILDYQPRPPHWH
jgi:hypothetical protein